MTTRRNLVLGGLCAAGVVGGEVMIPRRKVSLLGSARIGDLAPMAFGGWKGRDVSDLIAPQGTNSLQNRLYGETVERTYVNDTTGAGIMMLLAHGDTQSNDLQLHRPEVCYPAFGFRLQSSIASRLSIGPDGALPIRRIVAVAGDRRENIVYWTRLGEYLPLSGSEQRAVRFKNALQGFVADGLLARFSTVGGDPDTEFGVLETFVREFLTATRPQARPAFIGSRLAMSIRS